MAPSPGENADGVGGRTEVGVLLLGDPDEEAKGQLGFGKGLDYLHDETVGEGDGGGAKDILQLGVPPALLDETAESDSVSLEMG